MFSDLIAASDTQINAAFTDEGGDVGGGQEDQRNGQVLDQSDVEAGFAAELDVTAGEKVESCLLQTSFCRVEFSPSALDPSSVFLGSCSCGYRCVYESQFGRELAFGHGEEETAFEAFKNGSVSRDHNKGLQLRLTHWLTRSMAME